jgi:soluble lytic murein transglycosylase-like protein
MANWRDTRPSVRVAWAKRLKPVWSAAALAVLGASALVAADPAVSERRAAVELQRAAAAKMRTTAERQRAQTIATMRGSIERQRASAIRVGSRWAGPLTSFFRGPAVQPADCEPMNLEQLNPLLERAAEDERLEPELLRAVVEQESGFRPCAVSSRGALGLMQLMPATLEDFGVRDAFDPRENVESGARFLRQLLDRYDGDLALALAAYNAGPGKVDSANRVPPFAETLQYVSDLLKRLKKSPSASTQQSSR